MEIRPMREDDVEAVVAVGSEALWSGGPEEGWWRRARIEHVLATDPDGAWVAEADGEVVGSSMAIVRERMWGLSFLAVLERTRARGAGRELVRAACSTLDRAEGGVILSSEHPAAMRLYATSGFALRPCVALSGPVRFRPDRPAEVADLGDRDVDWMDDVARAVRGGPYSGELPLWRARDATFLGIAGRAWLAALEGKLLTLVATDEEAATLVLRAYLAQATDAAIDFVTAGHDWAIAEGLAADLALSPDGPVYVRGAVGTLAPYLPNGAFL
jgi:predicted N-acetyltransferase YhbS